MDNINSKYKFSSKVAWLEKGGQFWGTVGVTAGGRLEFTLQDGKLIFSAPLSLTKQRWMDGQIRWFVVIGSRRYTLQFFEQYTKFIVLYRPLFQQINTARQNYPAFKAWKDQVEAFTPPPADDDAIVAADLPAYLKPVAHVGQQGVVSFIVAVFTFMLITITLMTLFKAGKIPVGGLWGVAAAFILLFIGGNIWSYGRYKKLTTLVLPTPSAAELETDAHDILPAGTMPNAKLGMSTGVAILLGLAVSAAIIWLI
ncbi:MAG TPA: hypothetical protein VLE99_04420 [Candidatus Saccharimonadales bacterium]|nr:hypothetical protein [Candidatus Saccharimonadales bacterium]